MHPVRLLSFLALGGALVACGDVENPDGRDDEQEVVTTVELTVIDETNNAVTYRWADPEDDGDPVVDPVELDPIRTYQVLVSFLNELEDPAEDLTSEVADEAEQHQVFFTGDAVEGPATGDNPAALVQHSYLDEDAGGLPLGLSNQLVPLAEGGGELIVTLRHLPPESGTEVKVEGLAEAVADGGFASIGGDNDAQVSFPITVAAPGTTP